MDKVVTVNTKTRRLQESSVTFTESPFTVRIKRTSLVAVVVVVVGVVVHAVVPIASSGQHSEHQVSVVHAHGGRGARSAQTDPAHEPRTHAHAQGLPTKARGPVLAHAPGETRAEPCSVPGRPVAVRVGPAEGSAVCCHGWVGEASPSTRPPLLGVHCCPTGFLNFDINTVMNTQYSEKFPAGLIHLIIVFHTSKTK